MKDKEKLDLKTILYRLRHKNTRGWAIAIWGKKVISSRWGMTPVPLWLVHGLANAVSGSNLVDGLLTQNGWRARPGSELNNPILSGMIADQCLGIWSLGVDALNFLEFDIKRKRPQAILEFGSGISTLCLAQIMKEIHGDSNTGLVYSIEQNEKFAVENKKLVHDHGFDRNVKILHAPLVNMQVEGINCFSYDLQNLSDFLGEVNPDYCLIDGPYVAGFDGRFATLPLIRKYFDNCQVRFVLDDALRAKELYIAKKWKRLAYIDIQGVILTQKGLLVGFTRR